MSSDTDSRTDTRGFSVISLNENVKKEISQIEELLGIHYAAWDIIIDEDERHYLLDLNPGPYIMWIGEYLARQVMGQLARFIIAFNETNDVKKASECVREINPLFKEYTKKPPLVRELMEIQSDKYKNALNIGFLIFYLYFR
jgi:hypothetical protein